MRSHFLPEWHPRVLQQSAEYQKVRRIELVEFEIGVDGRRDEYSGEASEGKLSSSKEVIGVFPFLRPMFKANNSKTRLKVTIDTYFGDKI